MFSKILGKIKNTDGEKDSKLLKKIAMMDLVEMRTYVNGKLTEFEVNEFGLQELINKLIHKNEDTEKYYIKDDDMDSKKKKAFDLLVLILAHKKISVSSLEAAQKFLDIYNEIIKKYDRENKQIFESKIKDSMSKATSQLSLKAGINAQINLTN